MELCFSIDESYEGKGIKLTLDCEKRQESVSAIFYRDDDEILSFISDTGLPTGKYVFDERYTTDNLIDAIEKVVTRIDVVS